MKSFLVLFVLLCVFFTFVESKKKEKDEFGVVKPDNTTVAFIPYVVMKKQAPIKEDKSEEEKELEELKIEDVEANKIKLKLASSLNSKMKSTAKRRTSTCNNNQYIDSILKKVQWLVNVWGG